MAFPKIPRLLLASPKNKYSGGIRCASLFPVGKGLGMMATPSLARKRVIKVFSLNWNFLFPSLITKGQRHQRQAGRKSDGVFFLTESKPPEHVLIPQLALGLCRLLRCGPCE